MEPSEEKTDISTGRKRVNSLLFILGATVANVILMIALFLLLSFLYGRLLARYVGQNFSQIMIVLIFFLSVATSYFCYHFLIKWLSEKVDMDRYFDPVFRIGGKKR